MVEYLCVIRHHFDLLPRDTIQARPMPSCGVRPSVCLSVTFLYYVETNKHIFNFFNRRVATPFYFFNTKRHGNIPTEPP